MDRFKPQEWETSPTWDTGSPRHLFNKALEAHRGGHTAWVSMSTGEKVGVALVLNQSDWLARLDFSITDAMDRAGETWVLAMPRIAHLIASETHLG